MRCVRWWVAACGAACMALFVGLVGVHALGGVDEASLYVEMARIASISDDIRGEADRLGQELAEVDARLATNLAVGGQPDWSVLLALLADTMGEEIALSEVRLGRGGDLSAPSPGGRRARPTRPTGNNESPTPGLTIGGVGRTQNAVVHFALRLEETGLFDEVRLVDPRRQPYHDGYVVSFRLECSMEQQP